MVIIYVSDTELCKLGNFPKWLNFMLKSELVYGQRITNGKHWWWRLKGNWLWSCLCLPLHCHVLGDPIKCTHFYDCSIFLRNWPFCHYEMSLWYYSLFWSLFELMHLLLISRFSFSFDFHQPDCDVPCVVFFTFILFGVFWTVCIGKFRCFTKFGSLEPLFFSSFFYPLSFTCESRVLDLALLNFKSLLFSGWLLSIDLSSSSLILSYVISVFMWSPSSKFCISDTFYWVTQSQHQSDSRGGGRSHLLVRGMARNVWPALMSRFHIDCSPLSLPPCSLFMPSSPLCRTPGIAYNLPSSLHSCCSQMSICTTPCLPVKAFIS